jgi:hypothetical protein
LKVPTLSTLLLQALRSHIVVFAAVRIVVPVVVAYAFISEYIASLEYLGALSQQALLTLTIMPDSPPPVNNPYDPTKALDDIPGLHFALHEFLQSRMHESERFCEQSDPDKYVLPSSSLPLQKPRSLQTEIVLCDWIWAYSMCEGSHVF